MTKHLMFPVSLMNGKAGGISMVNSNLAYQDISTSEVPQIKDDPVKWCSVSLSDVIKRGMRLEASVLMLRQSRLGKL